MHIVCLEKNLTPLLCTLPKKPTVFTYCYLYMHGYRASTGAWVPQSPLSVACICEGIEPSIGHGYHTVHLVPFVCAWVQGRLLELR